MTAPPLDPNPKNQLGKGIFAAELESELLAEGFIFACELPKSRLPFGVLNVCKRLIADAVTEQELNDPHVPRFREYRTPTRPVPATP